MAFIKTPIITLLIVMTWVIFCNFVLWMLQADVEKSEEKMESAAESKEDSPEPEESEEEGAKGTSSFIKLKPLNDGYQRALDT